MEHCQNLVHYDLSLVDNMIKAQGDNATSDSETLTQTDEYED